MWFRATEKTGIQFIASFRNGKNASEEHALPGNIEFKNSLTLNLKSFEKNRDSGNYSCAKYNKNALEFGQATFVQGTPGEIITDILYIRLIIIITSMIH